MSESSLSIRRATAADRETVVRTVVAAFVRDPAFRFFFPDDGTYEQQATHFAGYLFDKRVVHDSVWMTTNGAATALWSPPAATTADVAISASGGENAAHDLRVTMLEAIGPDAAARLNAYDEAVDALLPADDSYWYLGVLALHPDYRGSGLGRAVMHASLGSRSDDAGARPAPAYLETTNPANVGYYQRCGWQVTNTASTDLGPAGGDKTGLHVTVLRYE